MYNPLKSSTSLRPSSMRRLNWALRQLQEGSSYRDVNGHKLHSHSDAIEWISIRLSQCDRAIIAKKRDGGIRLLYVGTHTGYDKIVGPKLKKRLVNPWLNAA